MLIGSEKAEERTEGEEPESPSASGPTSSDVQPDPDPESIDGEEPAGPSASPGVRRSPLLLTAIALLVVLVIVETVIIYSDHSRISRLNALKSAQSSALATARSDSLAIASYDYRHLNADFTHVETLCTPSFAVTYSQSSKSLIALLSQYKATATASVLGAGVESSSTSRVVALVFVNQTITNSLEKTSTVSQRLEITLLREHGRWLIDDLVLP
jgi:Mce-associated membrane protein